ncbi:MAG: sulfate ABC transporter permease subunit CysT [Armatimonadota bacterium]|nr:sulfate ABC transporter permease subunit CysT [Armatimonadota bacterium]
MAVTIASPKLKTNKARRVLPGFGLSLGYTIFYLSLLVLIPLSTTFFKAATVGHAQFWHAITDPRTVAAFKLSFGMAALAAAINAVFGLLVAWTLVRYPFPGRRVIDGLVDLPFALPTAVAGICLSAVYAENGWIGAHLYKLHFAHTAHGWTIAHGDHLDVAYTPLGILVALVFIGLPFVVRTVQPVLQDLETDVEEAAASLGATRAQIFLRVLLPTLLPAVLTGFTLAFARALGEYGSVIFISNNIPLQGEIVPKLIMDKLDQFDYAGATVIAVVMLLASFVLLLLINLLQWWSRKRLGMT